MIYDVVDEMKMDHYLGDGVEVDTLLKTQDP